MMAEETHVIIGGGPAGLAAAYELSKFGYRSITLDKDLQLGGLCKTVEYRGFRCDIGGHRFFTKNQEVQHLWSDILAEDFLVRSRLSRIYYQGKFFYYPLKVANALGNLGIYDSLRIIASYCKSNFFPIKPESDFESWVSNRFGSVLYSIFFKTYTEKLWGIPCNELSADWAAQRIKNLSLGRALLNALGLRNGKKVTSLIEEFNYPRLGPGQMYEAMAKRVQKKGGEIILGREVVQVHHKDGRIKSVQTLGKDGFLEFPVDYCFSSMPISELIHRMRPFPPDNVVEAANSLRYRSIITVNLLFKQPITLRDNWIYLHSPEIAAGRLQLYHNWSPDMVPQSEMGTLGFEYFCFENDTMWRQSDSELIQLALDDLKKLGFCERETFLDGFVVKYAKAYPMYEDNYEMQLCIIKDWLSHLKNLYCIGRYGQFRYNNMDHSIITGLLAVRHMIGENVDPWSVNAEGAYLEEVNHK